MPTFHIAFMPSQPQPQVHLPLHMRGTPYARPNYPSEPILFKQHGDSVDHKWSKTQPQRQPQLPKVVYTILLSCVPNHNFLL